MKLSKCLESNKLILGQKCENLGKATGSCFFPRKVFLSYSEKEGWQVVILNIIQLFLRKVFGAYQSTHLNPIAERVSKIESSDGVRDCKSRIQTVWAQKNLVRLGNAPLSSAQIIGFPEEHFDRLYQTSVAPLINALYKEGDVILVEGREAGKAGERSAHKATEDLKEDCVIMGWEPQNFKELHGAFRKSEAKYQELLACGDYLKTHFSVEGSLTTSQITDLRLKVNELVGKIEKLNEYYQSTDPCVLEAKSFLCDLFEKLTNGTLFADNPMGVFSTWTFKILSRLEKEAPLAMHTNMTPEERKEVFKTVPIRNASLVAEIDKYLNMGKRVFVIAGAAHLLRYPSIYGVEEVRDILQKNQFALVAKKDLFAGISKFNSDLKPLPLAAMY